jgi:glutamine amidotransferase
MIAIIDYGASNLSSVAKAVVKLGLKPVVTSSPEDVLAAQAVLLPGVGAAGDAIARLKARKLTNAIRTVVTEGRPFFGICLGYQVLFEKSEEGDITCLGLLPGKVVRLREDVLKVPHMGWNQVRQRIDHPLFEGISDCSDFYFVHSYYPDVADRSLVAGETEYGVYFCSLLVKGNLVASQFHPEKSGDVGLRMLRNFFAFAKIP